MTFVFPGPNAKVCSVDSDLVSHSSIAGRPSPSTSLMAMPCECAPRHGFSYLVQHDS